jgi:hypothetical protein
MVCGLEFREGCAMGGTCEKFLGVIPRAPNRVGIRRVWRGPERPIAGLSYGRGLW